MPLYEYLKHYSFALFGGMVFFIARSYLNPSSDQTWKKDRGHYRHLMKLITFFASWMPNTESAVQPANSVVPLFMEPFARDKAVSECSVDPYCFFGTSIFWNGAFSFLNLWTLMCDMHGAYFPSHMQVLHSFKRRHIWEFSLNLCPKTVAPCGHSTSTEKSKYFELR
jgi:hypothetical protein